MLGVPVREHAKFGKGATRHIVVIVNESTDNECLEEAHQMMLIADITDETIPQVISNYQCPSRRGTTASAAGASARTRPTRT